MALLKNENKDSEFLEVSNFEMFKTYDGCCGEFLIHRQINFINREKVWKKRFFQLRSNNIIDFWHIGSLHKTCKKISIDKKCLVLSIIAKKEKDIGTIYILPILKNMKNYLFASPYFENIKLFRDLILQNLEYMRNFTVI